MTTVPPDAFAADVPTSVPERGVVGPLRVLVVDDDAVDRMAVRRGLARAGVEARVEEVGAGAAALERLASEAFDCVFLDYNLPGGNGLSLLRTLRSSSAASLVAHADPEKVRQILLNLLSNAIKFTEPGGRIVVEAEAARQGVEIRVADTGVGIPADKLVDVFSPFVQVDRDLTSTHEGTGLGLAISLDLARAMGGDLAATSAVGVGSTFTLTLRHGPGRERTGTGIQPERAGSVS